MRDDYKFLSDERKSKYSSPINSLKYKHPERQPPKAKENKYLFTKSTDQLPGYVAFTGRDTSPQSNAITIDILISFSNSNFGFGIESQNSSLFTEGTVDWGQGNGIEYWNIPVNNNYQTFSRAYQPGEYRISITFENPEYVARLELDSGEVSSARCITSVTNLQLLQNPYQIDIDRHLLTYLDLGNIPSLTECWALDNQLTYLNLQGSTGLTDIEFYNNRLSNLDISGLVNLDYALLYNNEFTQAAVDSMLSILDQNGLTNGRLELYGGLNAAPSQIGLTAKANLQARGWSVSTN